MDPVCAGDIERAIAVEVCRLHTEHRWSSRLFAYNRTVLGNDEMKLSKIVVTVISAGIWATPAGAHHESPKFDIFGIKLGDTADSLAERLRDEAGGRDAQFTPAPCVKQTLDRIQAELDGRPARLESPRCTIRAFTQLDDVTSVEVTLAEDYPTLPGISVVTRVSVAFHGLAANDASRSEFNASITARFGEPEQTPSDGRMIWGAPPCAPSGDNCHPRSAYIESAPGLLVLADDELAHRLYSQAEATIEAAKSGSKRGN